jgi:hypothetical protein
VLDRQWFLRLRFTDLRSATGAITTITPMTALPTVITVRNGLAAASSLVSGPGMDGAGIMGGTATDIMATPITVTAMDITAGMADTAAMVDTTGMVDPADITPVAMAAGTEAMVDTAADMPAEAIAVDMLVARDMAAVQVVDTVAAGTQHTAALDIVVAVMAAVTT